MMIFEQMPERIERRSVAVENLYVRVECARRADVALRTDLLRRLNLVLGFDRLRLCVQYLNVIPCRRLGAWVPLLDHNATEFGINLLDSTIDRRSHPAVRQHAPAAAHIEADVRSCTLAPGRTEGARWQRRMAVFWWLKQIDQSLNYWIGCHSLVPLIIPIGNGVAQDRWSAESHGLAEMNGLRRTSASDLRQSIEKIDEKTTTRPDCTI